MSIYASYINSLGPVGYWRLGEASGTNAVDEVGSNDGTYTNAPTLGTAGLLANSTDTAAAFVAASSQYVTMGDVLDFDKDEPFSVAIWLKNNSATSQSLVNKAASGSTGWGVYIDASGYVVCYVQNTSVTDTIVVTATTDPVADNATHFVVATYDGSEDATGVTIYVDGSPATDTDTINNLTGSTLNASPLQIGCLDSSSLYNNGTLDEAAVFDFELSAAEITTLNAYGLDGSGLYQAKVNTYSPLGYWRLGEVSGTTMVDETTNYDGAYVNTPTLKAASLISSSDDDLAVTFASASSEYATINALSAAGLDEGDAVTISLWFQTTSTADSILFSANSASDVDMFRLGINGTTPGKLFVACMADAITEVGTSLNDGNPHNVVCVWVLSYSLQVFVDGDLAATVVSTPVSWNLATKFSLAQEWDATATASDFFNGTLDEVFIASSILTVSQISELYSLGLALLGEYVYESTATTSTISDQLGRSVTEALVFTSGLGILEFMTESAVSIDTAALRVRQVEALADSVATTSSETLEQAKLIIESLATTDSYAQTILAYPSVAEELTVADVIRLTWEMAATDSTAITSTSTGDIHKAVAIVETLLLTGLVSTKISAIHAVAEALVLADVVKWGFEKTATDAVATTSSYAIQYRAMVAEIEAVAGTDSGTGTLSAGLLITDSVALTDSITLAQHLHMLITEGAVIGGTIVLPDGVYTAYVVNSQSLGLSEYDNFPFTSFGKLGQTYLGATDTNIYSLDGSDDAGTDIDAVIRSGMTNFGTNLFKRVPRAYLGYTSDGGLVMKAISTSGGTKTERWYELTARTGDHASTAHAAARIQLGRGVKATYWQFELINVSGADFDIDSLQLFPMVLSRRI